MATTDELRHLLDERGAEWEDMSTRPYSCTLWRDPDGEPCTALEGADDIPDGKLSAQALLTPAQAVDATLGRGTCRIEHVKSGAMYDVWRCSECGYEYAERVDEESIIQNFCPNCGRKVKL